MDAKKPTRPSKFAGEGLEGMGPSGEKVEDLIRARDEAGGVLPPPPQPGDEDE